LPLLFITDERGLYYWAEVEFIFTYRTLLRTKNVYLVC
jgi:hypothetical protein